MLILSELAAEHPVFYADGPHAMVLVSADAINGVPIAGWVMDPAPALPVGMGPITAPGVQAIGVRQLQPGEMHAFFAAQVVVH